MDRHTFTVSPTVDPIALGQYQAKLAKATSRHGCMSCGKTVPERRLAAGHRQVCADREACRVRSIFRHCTYANAA